MFRNLIFDWSGTLVDDMGPVLEATNAVLAHYGCETLDREQFRRRFRLPYGEFYQELLPGVPLEELEQHFRLAFDAARTPVTVLPHAAEKLAWCARNGIRMFVLSSMDATAFARQLRGFGWEGLFEATYAGVLDKRDQIHQLLDAHQLARHETAFVGDMTHDVETARHGGVVSIAVLTGYQHADQLAAVRPDLTVPDLLALRGLLERGVSAAPRLQPDCIEIRRMRVMSHVGVPDEELAVAQPLWISITMIPSVGFGQLDDAIERTVPYDVVHQQVLALAAERPRRLIETLATDVADLLLAAHPLREVTVAVEKHILPDTDAVLVRVTRSSPGGGR